MSNTSGVKNTFESKKIRLIYSQAPISESCNICMINLPNQHHRLFKKVCHLAHHIFLEHKDNDQLSVARKLDELRCIAENFQKGRI